MHDADADACMLKCDAEGLVQPERLAEPWAVGRGGAAPALPGLGCGTDVPASDRRPEIARALTRSLTRALTLNRPARQRIYDRAIGP
jgi:hypothetical protein